MSQRSSDRDGRSIQNAQVENCHWLSHTGQKKCAVSCAYSKVDECTRRVSAVSRNGHYSIKIADEKRVTRETNRSSISFLFPARLGQVLPCNCRLEYQRTTCRQDTCLVWLMW